MAVTVLPQPDSPTIPRVRPSAQGQAVDCLHQTTLGVEARLKVSISNRLLTVQAFRLGSNPVSLLDCLHLGELLAGSPRLFGFFKIPLSRRARRHVVRVTKLK